MSGIVGKCHLLSGALATGGAYLVSTSLPKYTMKGGDVVARLKSKKQEEFVRKVASGMPQREAFRSVYKNKMTDAQVDAEASAMINGTGKYAKNPKIHQRYLELNEAANASAEEKTIADIREMQEKLTEIIRQQLEEEVIVVDPTTGAFKMKKTASVKDIISAVNTLGKMQGAFVEKLDVKNAVSVMIVDDLDE